MNAFILGGGKSTRMKADKTFLEFNGKRLIDITIACASGLFRKVYLVGREYAHPLLAGSFGDAVEGIGPLGGIYRALQITETEYNFFVGTDYPYITRDLILHIASKLTETSSHYDGCIPVTPDGLHPLFAFYGKACLDAVKRCIASGDYRVRCIGRHSRILLLPLVESLDGDRLSLAQKSLVNINSYDDYLRLKGQSADWENTI